MCSETAVLRVPFHGVIAVCVGDVGMPLFPYPLLQSQGGYIRAWKFSLDLCAWSMGGHFSRES